MNTFGNINKSSDIRHVNVSNMYTALPLPSLFWYLQRLDIGSSIVCSSFEDINVVPLDHLRKSPLLQHLTFLPGTLQYL